MLIRRHRWSRREALALLGAGAAGAVAACGRNAPGSMPADDRAAAQASPPAPALPTIVRTILRDMSPDELSHGATLFHEHLSMNNEFWLDMGLERLVDTSRPYFMEDLDFMVAEMRAAAEDGIACIVDGGHADMGRDVEFLRALSAQSGMPIVASGGYYHEPTFPPDLYERSEDDLVEEFLREAGPQRWARSAR